MATIYKYRINNVINEVLSESEVPLGAAFEVIGRLEESEIDYIAAQQNAMVFGKSLAESLAMQIGAKAKKIRIENGIVLSTSLVDINEKLEAYLNKGALYPDALSEIEAIVSSGQVDNFIDIYADTVLRIDSFLGV